jgi:hypothetical protein
MECRACGAKHGGNYGSLCEDCQAEAWRILCVPRGVPPYGIPMKIIPGFDTDRRRAGNLRHAGPRDDT